MRHSKDWKADLHLPREVQSLATRERELATFVYRNGSATAKDIEAALCNEITNAAIRSMLTRLCNKKILKKRRNTVWTTRNARRTAFIYFPAVDHAGVKLRAIEQVASDYFDGSIEDLAKLTEQLLSEDMPEKLVAGRTPSN